MSDRFMHLSINSLSINSSSITISPIKTGSINTGSINTLPIHTSINGILIVEGQTEQIFVEKLLAPYLAEQNIFITATQVSKKGQKGGDVKFQRVLNDLKIHLKQKHNHFVSTFVDYYGIKEWPGTDAIQNNHTPQQIANIINAESKKSVQASLPNLRTDERYLPFWQYMNLRLCCLVMQKYWRKKLT